jgi:outer membrane receptor protein involved in Fe transport
MPGKFGYAFVYGVEGTYGNFPGATIAQTGLRGTDFTRATLAGLTYHVSGDYDLRNELAKLTYDPSASTKLTLSAYGATSWADKTGEGDNDDNPYAYTLANAPIGASASCPHGVVAATDSGPSCLTPAAYASGASGPAGGGPDAWQALRNEDYDIRASTNFGKNTLAIDAFTDAYVELYHRGASVVNGPLDAFLDRWSTQGARASDEIGWRTSSLGFGFAYLRQVLGGDATSPDGSTLVTAVPVSRIEARSFVSEIFAPSPRLTVRGFADVKRSNGDVVTRVDPQAALTYRFAPRDTVRLAAGRATDEPSLQTDRVDLLPVGALNPDCGAIAKASPGAPATVVVGSGPAPGLAPETGTDIEAGYEHRFGADATLGLTAYDTNVTDRIVTGAFGAGTQLSPATLAPFFGRIADFCGAMPAPGAIVFGLNRAFNVASARLRGFDMSGRVRVVPHLAFDYAYDVQSSVLNGLPPSVLASDPTLVNGLQVFDVPLHTATLGVEFATATGMTLRLDGHAVGPNNPQQLPGYAYADASLTQTVSGHVVLRVAVTNLFDGHAQAYGFEGLGLPYATNALNAAIARPFLQPDNERYGLAPTSLTASVSLRL